MRQRTIWLASAGAGAATAYLLDPISGNRRRRRVADAIVHYTNQTGDAAATVGRDLRNRTRGVVAELQRKIRSIPVDDRVLQERVRAAMGRVISHPHAVAVKARGGHVTLTGPVKGAEEHRLLSTVIAIDGVKNVDTRFERRQRSFLPSLRAVSWRRSWPAALDVRRRNWAPATRTIAGSAGTALVAAGLARRGKSGAGLAAAGAAVFLRALTNLEFRRLAGAGRRAIDVQKTLTVDAPADQAFAFWDDFANFPRFMRHVREVRPTREPLVWRWSVSGTSTAAPIEYHAVITERVLNRVLAWKTTPDSAVGHAGVIRFEPMDDGRTRIHVRLSYNPPGGALAHGVLALFGADPKSRLDEDMVRMKNVLEMAGPRAKKS